jgi:endonuclease-3
MTLPDPRLPPEAAEALLARLAAANPAPRTELYYTSPFTLLVAVLLSAQATDAGVNRATRTLFEEAPTPGAMLALGEEGVRERIRRSACSATRPGTWSSCAGS